VDAGAQQFGGRDGVSGTATSLVGAGGSADFASFGSSRKTVFGMKLDKVADSVSGQTVVDPKGASACCSP
jgi:pre-mRNA-processing factor 6